MIDTKDNCSILLSFSTNSEVAKHPFMKIFVVLSNSLTFFMISIVRRLLSFKFKLLTHLGSSFLWQTELEKKLKFKKASSKALPSVC